jgi:signal transduction histidine kinase
MTKAKVFWGKRVRGPEKAFLMEASSSFFGRNLSVPLIFSTTIFSTGFLFPSKDYFGISVHLLDATTFPASVLIFLIFNLFKSKTNGVWLNLTYWLATGLFSAVGSTITLLALTGQVSEEILSQIPIGILAYSLLTAVTSVITSGILLSRGRLRALKQQRGLLSKIRGELETQIETMRGEIKESVQGELSKAIRSLNEISNPQDLSSRLMLAIDEVIRPLSHRLAAFGVSTNLPKVPVHTLSQTESRLGVSISRLAAPEVYALLFIVFILPASFFVDGLTGFVSAAALLGVQILFLILIERFGANLFLSRIVGMILLAAAGGLVGLGYLLLLPQNPNFGITIGFVTTSLAVTGLMALVSKRLDDLRELSIVNQALQEVVSLLRQEAWVTKTRLAKAIHGSVQAKFLAVALRLGERSKLTKTELALARKDIEYSVAEVESSFSGNSIPFSKQFQTISEAWDGVAKLHLEVDSATIESLDRLPVARTCVLEVINEAVANAAKHSKAPTMNIELQENPFSQVVVSVWSAGKLSTQPGRKGYGSQMLDEVTSSWSLTNLKGRVYLRAVIPLSK